MSPSSVYCPQPIVSSNGFKITLKRTRVQLTKGIKLPSRGHCKRFYHFLFNCYNGNLKSLLKIAVMAEQKHLSAEETDALVDFYYHKLEKGWPLTPSNRGPEGFGIHHVTPRFMCGGFSKEEAHAFENLCYMLRRTEVLLHAVMDFINPHVTEFISSKRPRGIQTDVLLITPNTPFWPYGIGKTWTMIEKCLRELRAREQDLPENTRKNITKLLRNSSSLPKIIREAIKRAERRKDGYDREILHSWILESLNRFQNGNGVSHTSMSHAFTTFIESHPLRNEPVIEALPEISFPEEDRGAKPCKPVPHRQLSPTREKRRGDRGQGRRR